MDRNEKSGYGDEQGTRVGAPDQERTPATHADSPPNRPERQTGAGSELPGTREPRVGSDGDERGRHSPGIDRNAARD